MTRIIGGVAVSLINIFYKGTLFFNAIGLDLPTWLGIAQTLTDADFTTVNNAVQMGALVGKVDPMTAASFSRMAPTLDKGYNALNGTMTRWEKGIVTRQIAKSDFVDVAKNTVTYAEAILKAAWQAGYAITAAGAGIAIHRYRR